MIDKRMYVMLKLHVQVDDIVYDKELNSQLQLAISELPETQKRRFLLYYDCNLTYDQIADMEGCTKMPIKRSLDRARENILKKLNIRGYF